MQLVLEHATNISSNSPMCTHEIDYLKDAPCIPPPTARLSLNWKFYCVLLISPHQHIFLLIRSMPTKVTHKMLHLTFNKILIRAFCSCWFSLYRVTNVSLSLHKHLCSHLKERRKKSSSVAGKKYLQKVLALLSVHLTPNDEVYLCLKEL
jgi:hypothetical protein